MWFVAGRVWLSLVAGGRLLGDIYRCCRSLLVCGWCLLLLMLVCSVLTLLPFVVCCFCVACCCCLSLLLPACCCLLLLAVATCVRRGLCLCDGSVYLLLICVVWCPLVFLVVRGLLLCVVGVACG